MQKKRFVLTVVLLYPLLCLAQFVINNPRFGSKESNSMSISKLRVYPDKIWFDLVYQDSYNPQPGFRFGRQSFIKFSRVTNWSSAINDLRGATYDVPTSVKTGSVNAFSASFPFSVYELMKHRMEPSSVGDILFFRDSTLLLQLINCSDEYKQQMGIMTGNCFNFYDLQLRLPAHQFAELYCHGFLNEFLEKGEFENTATYNKRTGPTQLRDTLRKNILSIIDMYLVSLYPGFVAEVPDLKYNADAEVFTVTIKNMKPIGIRVPVAKAKAFKDDVLQGRLELSDVELQYGEDIRGVIFSGANDKLTEYKNIYYTQGSDPFLDRVVQKVLTSLAGNYPKKDLW